MRKASPVALPALVVMLLAGASLVHGKARAPADVGASPAGDVAAVLKRQTQELMDAVAPGESEVWRRYLHEDAVYLDENGVVYDREGLLRELTPLSAGLVGRIEVDRFQVKRHGDTAVVAAELQEYLDYHGQALRTRFRFLDTWLRTPEGWRRARHPSELSPRDAHRWRCVCARVQRLG